MSHNIKHFIYNGSIYIKIPILSEDPISIFLDLVELHLQTADNIVNQLIDCLHKSGFDDNFLKNYWISFVSDGASVLVGKKKGSCQTTEE